MIHALRPATSEHIFSVCSRISDDTFSEFAEEGIVDRLSLAYFLRDFPGAHAFAWFAGDDLLGIVGVTESGVPGCGYPWAILTEEARRHRKALLKLAPRAAEWLADLIGATTLLVEKPVSRLRDLAWLRSLGFIPGDVDAVSNTITLTWTRP